MIRIQKSSTKKELLAGSRNVCTTDPAAPCKPGHRSLLRASRSGKTTCWGGKQVCDPNSRDFDGPEASLSDGEGPLRAKPLLVSQWTVDEAVELSQARGL